MDMKEGVILTSGVRKRRRLLLVIVALLLAFLAYSLFVKDNDNELDEQVAVDDEINEVDEEVFVPIPIEPMYTVFIDPGHGGRDGGAIGASGQLEKDFTLQLSLLVKALLDEEPDIAVHMTRNDDTFISSLDRERINLANELDADVFISIHGNTFSDPSVSGTETFYNEDDSYLLAMTLHREVVKATGFRDRGVRSEDYYVLRETQMPAALIEVGYLTNEEEERALWSDEVQADVAAAIVTGLKRYLGVEQGEGEGAGQDQGDGEGDLQTEVNDVDEN